MGGGDRRVIWKLSGQLDCHRVAETRESLPQTGWKARTSTYTLWYVRACSHHPSHIVSYLLENEGNHSGVGV